MAKVELRRCAIYTRKSNEAGLEQEFNNLDAQREACEAFVKSQSHEGWQALPTHYDDFGARPTRSDYPQLVSCKLSIGETVMGSSPQETQARSERFLACSSFGLVPLRYGLAAYYPMVSARCGGCGRLYRVCNDCVAEREGFEPSMGF